MNVQKLNYVTAGLLLVAALAVSTPQVQAEEQQLDNTQTGTEAPAATGSESSASEQPMGNGIQHNMSHDMPGVKTGDTGNMQHDMGNMQHNMPGMGSGNMQHDTPGTGSGTPHSPTKQNPAN